MKRNSALVLSKVQLPVGHSDNIELFLAKRIFHDEPAMNAKLSLESARWRMLRTIAGNASGIPSLIEEIRRQVTSGQGIVGMPFERLADHIYHQYSSCQATYAVVPYLVDLGRQVEYQQGVELWILVGHIAATHDLKEDEPPDDLLPAFRSALEDAEAVCISGLLASGWDLWKSYYLSVSAIGLTGHPLGALVMDDMFPEGSGESTIQCDRCGEHVRVAVFDEGLVVESDDVAYPSAPPPTLPDEPRAIAGGLGSANQPWWAVSCALSSLASGHRSESISLPHLEAGLCVAREGLRIGTTPCAVFSLLGDLLALKGFPGAGARYHHACDSVECPSCSARLVFAEHWWGNKVIRLSVFDRLGGTKGQNDLLG